LSESQQNEEKGQENAEAVVSVDEILEQADPTFLTGLNSLASDISDNVVATNSQESKKSLVQNGFKLVFQAPLLIVQKVKGRIVSAAHRVFSKAPSFSGTISGLKSILSAVRGSRDSIRSFVSKLTRLQKIQFYFLIVCLMGAPAMIIFQPWRSIRFGEKVYGRYEGFDVMWMTEKSEKSIWIRNPENHQDQPVHFEKIVVNIKPSRSSGPNPMVAFDLYIIASNEASAVEIKARQKEFSDLIQRVSEGFTYDEYTSVIGKKKIKIAIRKSINGALNGGSVQDINFKTFLTKP